jgi:hypothetical protein
VLARHDEVPQFCAAGAAIFAPKLVITGQHNDAPHVDEPIFAATLITVRGVPLDDLRPRHLAAATLLIRQRGDDAELAAGPARRPDA